MSCALPGGAIDLGDSVAQAAIRETREETGIDCGVTRLIGIYSDPKHIILYTSNGEAHQEFHRPDRSPAGRTADAER